LFLRRIRKEEVKNSTSFLASLLLKKQTKNISILKRSFKQIRCSVYNFLSCLPVFRASYRGKFDWIKKHNFHPYRKPKLNKKNAIVEYLDSQIPVTQLKGPKGNGDTQAAKRYWNEPFTRDLNIWLCRR